MPVTFRSLPGKIVGAVVVVAVSFGVTLMLLDYLQPLCPDGKTTALAPPYQKVSPYAYIASLPSLANLADNDASPARSPVIVCEGKYRIGPPHSLHSEIASLGRGRFSHVAGGLVFSTSDNSDPSLNGKQYTAVLPQAAR